MGTTGAIAFVIVNYFCTPEIYSWETANYKEQTIDFHAKQIPIRDLDQNIVKLQTAAATDLADMINQAAKDGVFIKVNYGYRDHETQKQVYKRNRRFAAKPGKSLHELGLAVDINGIKKDKNLRNWLKINAAKYGWKQTVRRERWHFEYQKPIVNWCPVPEKPNMFASIDFANT